MLLQSRRKTMGNEARRPHAAGYCLDEAGMQHRHKAHPATLLQSGMQKHSRSRHILDTAIDVPSLHLHA